MNPMLTTIAATVIALGIFVDPILSNPSISILHTFKSIINPTTIGPLYIIEYDSKDKNFTKALKTTLGFFAEFKKNSLLFSVTDWRNYKQSGEENTPLPLIGSTPPYKAPKQSPNFLEMHINNIYSYKLLSYKSTAPVPSMISVGLLPSKKYLNKYKSFFPLIYYNNDQKRIAFTSPFLATQRLFGDDPKRSKLRSNELHQFSTGADIPLNKRGEFRINRRPDLAKKIKRENIKTFEKFILSDPSPKLLNETILDKITLLLPVGENHEFLIQAFNTLSTQEFIQEINWLGWLIFAIPMLLLIFFAAPIKGLLFTTIVYLLCSAALYTFGNIVTPFLSAGFSTGLIMSLLYIFSGKKKRVVETIPTPDFSKNKKWDRFQIISTIKKSPFAVLYRVVDKENRKPALLKVFLEKSGILQQAKREHLRRAYSRLKSPFLANLYETSKIGDYLYQLTDDNGETTLSSIIAQGQLGVEKTVKITEQILKALELSHKSRIIHNNLTPSNILIDRIGSIKLTDFGWTTSHSARSPIQLNSLIYKAPELITGTKNPDHKSDLYSLGVIIYEMLTCETPFKAKNFEKLKNEKENFHLARIQEHNFEVPQWLDDFVSKLMARKPADRPLNASGALEILNIGYGK